jgi:hypothetical protein
MAQAQETIRLALGEVEIPLELVTALVTRHLLRSLRLASNGHTPSPPLVPDPEEAAAPVLHPSTGAP